MYVFWERGITDHYEDYLEDLIFQASPLFLQEQCLELFRPPEEVAFPRASSSSSFREITRIRDLEQAAPRSAPETEQESLED